MVLYCGNCGVYARGREVAIRVDRVQNENTTSPERVQDRDVCQWDICSNCVDICSLHELRVDRNSSREVNSGPRGAHWDRMPVHTLEV